MTKYFLIAVIALLSLASCKKTDNFSTPMQNQINSMETFTDFAKNTITETFDPASLAIGDSTMVLSVLNSSPGTFATTRDGWCKRISETEYDITDRAYDGGTWVNRYFVGNFPDTIFLGKSGKKNFVTVESNLYAYYSWGVFYNNSYVVRISQIKTTAPTGKNSSQNLSAMGTWDFLGSDAGKVHGGTFTFGNKQKKDVEYMLDYNFSNNTYTISYYPLSPNTGSNLWKILDPNPAGGYIISVSGPTSSAVYSSWFSSDKYTTFTDHVRNVDELYRRY